MTITPAATSVLADMMGGGSGTDRDIAMMIGIGLNKESDAVFFQYLGEEKQPAALTIPSNGKPLTYLRNVRLVGIEIAEDIGTFKSTKINVFLESGAGNVVMLTSGLTTLWSQFLVCGLSGLYQTYDLNTAFTLNSWKGTQGLKPCFASVQMGKERIVDEMLRDQLKELRSDRATDKVKAVMYDTVEILQHALKGDDVDAVTVQVQEPAAALPEDIDF